MDYEKKYKDLVEAVKELQKANPSNDGIQKWVENNVPELVESEDDRIRKELLAFCKNRAEKYSNDPKYKNISAWIAWLEKQAEQKLAKQPNSYELEEEIEEWLGCEAFPEGTNITPLPKAMDIVRETAYHFYDFGRKQQAIRNIQCTNSQVITPESYINEGQKKGVQMVLDNPQEYGLQKNAVWSEDDEKKLLCVCAWIKDYPRIADFKDEMYTVANNYIDWLKFLKERYTWKPSEGQLECLGYAIEKAEKDWSPLITNRIYLTLKALKEQLEKL